MASSSDKVMTRRMLKIEEKSPVKTTRRGVAARPSLDQSSPSKRKPPASRAELPPPSKPRASPSPVKNKQDNLKEAEKFSDSEKANTNTLTLEKKESPLKESSVLSSPSRKAGTQAKPEFAPSTPVKAKSDEVISKKNAELEKRDAELKEGSLILSQMKEKDVKTLLDNIANCCSPYDVRGHEFRFVNVKWNQVAFGVFSDKNCRAVWRFLRTGTRKLRIMSELVQEVRHAFDGHIPSYQEKLLESLPGFPPKHRNASPFSLYLKQRWDTRSEEEQANFPSYFTFQIYCKKEFDRLSEEEKKKWEKTYGDEKVEFNRQIEKYFEKHPEFSGFRAMYDNMKNTAKRKKVTTRKVRGSKEGKTKKAKLYTTSQEFPDAPQVPANSQALFIQSRLSKLDADDMTNNLTEYKQKYSRKWLKLSDKKKGKWIDKCIKQCEEFSQAVEAYAKEHIGYNPPPFKITQRVSKSDIAIWEVYKGRPARPPFTINELIQSQLNAEEGGKYSTLTPTQLKQLADKKWNDLSTHDKQFYKMHFQKLVLMHRKDIKEYYEALPEIVKPNIYATIPKKFLSEIQPPQQIQVPKIEECSNDNDTEDLNPITKKKHKSSEYVEDSSSSSFDFSKDPLRDPLELDFPLPKLEVLSSPERKHRVEEDERPKKKKKKKAKDNNVEQDYVVGIPSQYSDVEIEIEEPSTSTGKKKKKKTKKAKMATSEEESDGNYDRRRENFSFPSDDWNSTVQNNRRSSPSSSSSDSEVGKKHRKEFRDNAVSKFGKKRNQDY